MNKLLTAARQRLAQTAGKITPVGGSGTKLSAPASSVQFKHGAVSFNDEESTVVFYNLPGFESLEAVLDLYEGVPSRNRITHGIVAKTPKALAALLEELLRNIPYETSVTRYFTKTFLRSMSLLASTAQKAVVACEART